MVIAATIAACLVAAAVPAARAGDIWVTDGNMNTGQTGGCGAFSAGGDFGINPGYGTPIYVIPSTCPMSIAAGSVVPPGQNAFWMTTAPPGITIVSAWTASGDVTGVGNNQDGWIVGDFWRDVNTGAWGGSTLPTGGSYFNTGLEGATGPNGINSQIYGIQLECALSISCLGIGSPAFTVRGIELHAVEVTSPYVTGAGSLWATGSWVWNPPGDPWSISVYASDVSGICASLATIGRQVLNGPSEPRDNTVWQQCPNPVTWSFPVDTRSQVPTAGSFGITLSATNAAGVGGSPPTKTVSVDNDPVGVTFRTPNDANPTVWVNHAVTVDATATTGPSGVGGMNCNVDRGSAKAYPNSGLTINGDGVHTVSCTAWNRAVDPQGQPNTGSNSMSAHIDEAPPSLRFEPDNPGDPTGLVVDTSDTESGVANGSIQIASAGSGAWTNVPTSFDGAHLLAHVDDAGLRGAYDFRATSCDNVGNCATTTQRLMLPLRAAADQEVSLTSIVNPVRRKVTIKRIRVGWHWVTILRGNHRVRVRRGGHFKLVKVTTYVAPCASKRRPHTRSKRKPTSCAPPQVPVTTTLRVPYGRPVTIHGVYTTGQGVPIAGQPVRILAAPDNGFGAFRQVTTAATAADGSWTATLRPGPSRIIRAVTDGTSTILPSSGQVKTIVPARVRLIRVWPRHVAWGGTVHLVGQLFGGYLPSGGALARLRIGYKSTYNTYGVEEHVTGSGRFSTVATFGPGDPNVRRTYWFQIASLPMGNYPFAPAASQRVRVIVGGHSG